MTEYERLKGSVENAWREKYGWDISLEDTEILSIPGYWQLKNFCDLNACDASIHKFNLYYQIPVKHNLRFKDLIVEVDSDFSPDIQYGKLETTDTWKRLWEIENER